jgi:hypothetical protein
VGDDELPGCLATKTDENVKKVRTLARTHHHLGIRMIIDKQ